MSGLTTIAALPGSGSGCSAAMNAVPHAGTPAKKSESSTFNINEYVSVRLTDFGRKRHKEDFDQWTSAAGLTLQYHPPAEDEDGWSKWQLWVLMQLFGSVISMGCEQPFETTIRIHAT